MKVEPGYPAILANVIFPDDFEGIMWLGRYRAELEQVRAGTTGMLRLHAELLHQPDPERWIHATEAELKSVTNWADQLLKLLEKHDPLKVVLGVRDDFLGVHEYDAHDSVADEYAVNRASIRLYWGVIGLVAGWMGCAVENLTLVVLTHELAHAYTQLGADIAGRRWPASTFAKAETSLVEGLAQYYIDRVLRRLERRYPGALKVYEAMLPGQPEAYRTHEAWVKDFDPEPVRQAMLEVRQLKEGKLSDFNRRLAAAQKELHPERQ